MNSAAAFLLRMACACSRNASVIRCTGSRMVSVHRGFIFDARDSPFNLVQVAAMDGIPEAVWQRIRDLETLIAQHSQTVEDLRAGGSDRTDSARYLRMLKTALELVCGQLGTPPQPAPRDPGRLPSS